MRQEPADTAHVVWRIDEVKAGTAAATQAMDGHVRVGEKSPEKPDSEA